MFAHLVEFQPFGFHFTRCVSLLFSLFLTILMSPDYENNSNHFYHDYFKYDDDYCHIISDQIALFINFTPVSFVSNGQPSFQPDWSIDQVGNAISKKSILSLKVEYEIPSSIKVRKSQIGELVSQPPSGVIAFHPDFFFSLCYQVAVAPLLEIYANMLELCSNITFSQRLVCHDWHVHLMKIEGFSRSHIQSILEN